jgi:two-component system sensor histidine kinase TctE
LLDNLIDNALRHGRPVNGQPAEVTLSLESLARRVRLQVQDNGPGVPREWREQMQARWQRGPEGLAAADGHGLGLSIVSAYAQHLESALTLTESEAGGLCVSVELRPCDPPSVQGQP